MHKPLLLCLLFFCLAGCCGLRTQEKSGYSEISRTELQEEIVSSAMRPYREKGINSPRWRYSGSDFAYHYIWYHHITYFYYGVPPASGAKFYKIRKEDLSINVEEPFSPELRQAREVFRRRSSVGKLSLEEYVQLHMEKGYTPETAPYEFSIDYVNYDRFGSEEINHASELHQSRD